MRSRWLMGSRTRWPTKFTTAWESLPGTDTVMTSLPCCWTVASVKPAPLTRFSMIVTASCIWDAGGLPPLGVTAFSDTVVPLVRSKPR